MKMPVLVIVDCERSGLALMVNESEVEVVGPLLTVAVLVTLPASGRPG